MKLETICLGRQGARPEGERGNPTATEFAGERTQKNA
ncbi:hypothetical protein CLV58_12728 [Spirosoma oryzae]|uniref:Uncharacterized protein n=1 Tax=Spirosoma oryzae TaxID=1469603 RepID=A0A2T0S6N7_9BACT|nr:hypothetical protein CLV58_12728 [Spirosoma oryzae]